MADFVVVIVDLPVCFSLDSVFLPVPKYLLLDRFSGVLLNKPIAYSTSHPSSPLPALRLFAMWYRILPSTSSPSQLFSICFLFTTVLLSVSAIAIPSGSVSASQQHQKRNGKSTTSSNEKATDEYKALSEDGEWTEVDWIAGDITGRLINPDYEGYSGSGIPAFPTTTQRETSNRNKFVPSDDRSELNAIWAPYKAKWTNDIADAANQIKTFHPDSLLRIGRKKSGKRGTGKWVDRAVKHDPDHVYVLLFQDEAFAAEPTSSPQAVAVIEKGKLPTFPFTLVGNSKYLDADFFSSLKAYALFDTAEDKNSAVHNLRDIDTLQPKCGGVFKNSFDYVDCAVGYFKDNYARSEDKPRLDEMWKVYKAKRDEDLQNA
ncbi:hypothetical protein GG344DRAFT_67095 [Lentinula edodes]|nr:hypothetical protein GG344DRAFT_67095 [Lentinula edodes]